MGDLGEECSVKDGKLNGEKLLSTLDPMFFFSKILTGWGETTGTASLFPHNLPWSAMYGCFLRPLRALRFKFQRLVQKLFKDHFEVILLWSALG